MLYSFHGLQTTNNFVPPYATFAGLRIGADFMMNNCLICHKEFKTYHSFIKKGQGKFCSNKCRGEWISKNIIGKNHPNWKGGEINRI